MNPELIEELRSSMERFTEDVVMPSGLARSAYRRWRNRRITTAAAAAVSAAVVAGAAASFAVAGGTAGAQPKDAAYVVTRVEDALSAVAARNEISFSRTTASGLTPGAPATGFPWRTDLAWNTRNRFNELEYTSARRLFFSLTVTRIPAGLQLVSVSYLHRYVSFQKITGAGATGGCSTVAGVLSIVDLNPNDLTNWPATIRGLVGCRLVRVAGHQKGALIKFVAPLQYHYLSVVLLVDRTTFLPVRMVATWSQPGQGWKTTTEFGSLPRTKANLAHLSAPRPAGFQRAISGPPEAAGSNSYDNDMWWMFAQ